MGMTVPNLFILGAPKCGTTWIARILQENPDVFFATGKEIHFFDHPENFEKGLDWYSGLFRNAADAKWVCDGTPNYLATTLRHEHRMMAEHIRDMCSEAHFILSFRNPVDRTLSSILHQMRRGTLPPYLNCDDYVDRLLNGTADDTKHGILEFGNYAEQLQKYLTLFDRDRFHFVIFEEDIAEGRDNTVNRLCQFLDLDPETCLKSVDIRANPSLRTRVGLGIAQYGPPRLGRALARNVEKLVKHPKIALEAETRKKLWTFYEPMVPVLAGLIGRNLDIWKANPDP